MSEGEIVFGDFDDFITKSNIKKDPYHKNLDFDNYKKIISLGEMCYESMPCQHNLSIEMEDGSIEVMMLSGPMILKLVAEIGYPENASYELEHFTNYLHYIDQEERDKIEEIISDIKEKQNQKLEKGSIIEINTNPHVLKINYKPQITYTKAIYRKSVNTQTVYNMYDLKNSGDNIWTFSIENRYEEYIMYIRKIDFMDDKEKVSDQDIYFKMFFNKDAFLERNGKILYHKESNLFNPTIPVIDKGNKGRINIIAYSKKNLKNAYVSGYLEKSIQNVPIIKNSVLCMSHIKLGSYNVPNKSHVLFYINEDKLERCFTSLRMCFVDKNENKIITDDVFTHMTFKDDVAVYFENIPPQMFPIGNICDRRDGTYEFNFGMGNANEDLHHSSMILNNNPCISLKLKGGLDNVKLCIYATTINEYRITVKNNAFDPNIPSQFNFQ